MSDTLSVLLTELRERFAPGADVREVEIYLASRGYDARQIGEILALFAAEIPDRIDDRDPLGTAVARPEGPLFRVMGAHERGRFTPDAWGHLLALSASGALAPHEREHFIERALMQIDGRIGLGELRALLEGAGIDDGGAAGQTTIH